MNKRSPYFILLSWIWLAGLLLFLVLVTWDSGLLLNALAEDQTRISILLLILAALVSIHCGYRSYKLSRIESALLNWQNGNHDNSKSLISTYLTLMTSKKDKNLSVNGELLAEHFHYQHAYGWFATRAMIKLGLLGTVIGFIMMLTSISGLDSLEIEQVQNLMQRMTEGMMVALNTTLLGLVGSLILGIQYLFLDHCADQLLVRIITWVQQSPEKRVS